MLWVANGGTVLDTAGAVQNRAWQKYVSLIEQYAELIQDSDTYSLTAYDDSRFVRSFTSGGWGAWKRIADGTNGWIELVSNVAAHDRVSATNVLTHEIEGNFDARYFEEIEIEVESFGIYSDEGFANGGIHGNVQLRRTPGRSLDGLEPEHVVGQLIPRHATRQLQGADELSARGKRGAG